MRPVEPVTAILMSEIIEGNLRGGMKSRGVMAFFSITLQRVMVLVVLTGVFAVRFRDSGMAVHTPLLFFLGILGSRSRKWHKQKRANSGYRQCSRYIRPVL